MIQERHRELHQFILDRAGDAYRTGFHYREDGWKTMYIREDLATEQLENEMPDVIEQVRDRRALLSEETYPPLGEPQATTEVHDEGVIIHFPEGSAEGTIISLDREAARRLTGFVVQCQTILQTRTATQYAPQRVTD